MILDFVYNKINIFCKHEFTPLFSKTDGMTEGLFKEENTTGLEGLLTFPAAKDRLTEVGPFKFIELFKFFLKSLKVKKFCSKNLEFKKSQSTQ